jgi:hypothetical protein
VSEDTLTLAAPEKSPAKSPFRYDVFISYSHVDEPWVRQEFLPELENASLKVAIDIRDFAVGRPSVQNMVAAIQEARHIVAVLTPDWVASDWAGFEGYLVTTADPNGQQGRLLPLMLKPCKPPPHIAFLTYADFTVLGNRHEQLQRLLRAMKTQEKLNDALPLHTSHASEYARDGLQALVELMRQPEVRDIVLEYRVVFRDTRRQVEAVGNYKDLHDELHELQIQCYNRLIREMEGFPDDLIAVENLIDSKLTLESKINNVREIVARADYLSGEIAGLQQLQQAYTVLNEGLEALNPETLKRAAQKLGRVMALQPSKINAKLTSAAANLHLSDLVQTMGIIREQLTKARAEERNVHRFDDGVRGLSALQAALCLLIAEHDLWQEVDNRLHLIENDLDVELASLKDSWDEIREIAAPLYARRLEPWAEVFRLLDGNLRVAIEESNPAKAKSNFRLCRARASDRFYKVDVILKRFCDNLRTIGEPLAAVLEII